MEWFRRITLKLKFGKFHHGTRCVESRTGGGMLGSESLPADFHREGGFPGKILLLFNIGVMPGSRGSTIIIMKHSSAVRAV